MGNAVKIVLLTPLAGVELSPYQLFYIKNNIQN